MQVALEDCSEALLALLLRQGLEAATVDSHPTETLIDEGEPEQ